MIFEKIVNNLNNTSLKDFFSPQFSDDDKKLFEEYNKAYDDLANATKNVGLSVDDIKLRKNDRAN